MSMIIDGISLTEAQRIDWLTQDEHEQIPRAHAAYEPPRAFDAVLDCELPSLLRRQAS